jgi:hypothetical protein
MSGYTPMSGCTPMPVCARMSGNADVGVYPDVGVRDKICDRPRDKRVTKIGAVCDGIVVRHNRVASGGPKGVRDTVRDRVGDEARDKRVTKNRAMFCGCLRSFFCHASVGPFVTHMAGAPENNLKSNVSCTRWVCLSRTCWGGVLSHTRCGGLFVTHMLGVFVTHMPLARQDPWKTNGNLHKRQKLKDAGPT